MKDLWVVIRLSQGSKSRISNIREQLRPVIPNSFEEETDPHISVLPGFKLPNDEVEAFKNFVSNGIQHPNHVDVTGFDCYPESQPMVVMLSCNVDLESIRRKLLMVITHDAIDGEIKYPAYDPHITLFKGGDGTADDWELKDQHNQAIRTTITEIEDDQSVPTIWTDSDVSLVAEVRE